MSDSVTEAAAVEETATRGWLVEVVVAALVGAIFLGCLGSIELWGKREQRLAAEVVDTIENGRWLIAQIQGRPRLEKPPLPRWTTAALATVLGRCDEVVVRLPGALAALGTIGLTYLLGVRLGGRSLGLAAAMILGTTPLFISEARQAGQDVPLAFFTTLAIYAALRSLEGEGGNSGWPRRRFPSFRPWATTFHVAMGLGFLCKGPIILAIVGTTLLPFGLLARRFREIARLAFDPWGGLAFLTLALSWPLPVWWVDPNAVGVWIAEMGQKTGALPIVHRERVGFLAQWPALIAPWVVAGISGAILPFRRDRDGGDPWIWLPWCWSIGVALSLGLWAVAKPNYYMPCLPGFALLAGTAWLRLDRRAFQGDRLRSARALVFLQWGIWSVLGGSALALSGRALGAATPGWCALMAVTVVGAGVVGAMAGRRGWGPLAVAPALAATALAVVVGYGVVAPSANAARGHREIARKIDRALPAEVDAVAFFHELDEGLWFYLRGRRLEAVPGSRPRYNDAYDQITGREADGSPPASGLIARSRTVLAEWLAHESRTDEYLLLREKVYRDLGPELEGVSTPLLREPTAKRNGLVLLRLDPHPSRAAVAAPRPAFR
ncbi:ArnT family glycosyltransferase [Planctomyces sp. SH-PL62]|uniref:ArnT family glycosyltransferase n=1 Tax=Planctomyces sp. SH-PL62 TaxID=1636152 RepID=UPI00078E77A5|nr:glycosyltransferase family 39 protein [Planctomyces sp. SH-PL62]AMV40362.1 Undecaprenyl phosphate-alpha-4-amino-4-deoxy-L-arabinose arabinosyl transferase [Planctomyces sp. SH-PL62]